MGSSHFTDITCPWGGTGSKCRTRRFFPCRRGHPCFTNTCLALQIFSSPVKITTFTVTRDQFWGKINNQFQNKFLIFKQIAYINFGNKLYDLTSGQHICTCDTIVFRQDTERRRRYVVGCTGLLWCPLHTLLLQSYFVYQVISYVKCTFSRYTAQRDLFTIGPSCLQFLFTQNFIQQQYKAILKQINHL